MGILYSVLGIRGLGCSRAGKLCTVKRNIYIFYTPTTGCAIEVCIEKRNLYILKFLLNHHKLNELP